jgi:hypothetical protein
MSSKGITIKCGRKEFSFIYGMFGCEEKIKREKEVRKSMEREK